MEGAQKLTGGGSNNAQSTTPPPMPNPRPFTLPPHLRAQGHEDLRQDERVMQLFGLVNTMLANDRTTAERDLSIARYAVIPFSPHPCPPLHCVVGPVTTQLHLPHH